MNEVEMKVYGSDDSEDMSSEANKIERNCSGSHPSPVITYVKSGLAFYFKTNCS